MEKTKHSFVVLAYKESKYLEDCIKSVTSQTYSSDVVIATSTPNQYIDSVAKKFNLNVIVNPNSRKGIGHDFDFAVSCGNSELVTVAHQDDIYELNYAQSVVEAFEKYSDSLIIFSDYFEIRNDNKIYVNTNLKIKRILLMLVKFQRLGKISFVKRSCIAFGNAICCPAVTFVKNNIKYSDIFACSMKCDIDWYAWERLSKEEGRFVFIKESLMGHRVHEESTTTEIISNNIRTKEDLIMFKKFWPSPIANFLNKFYVKSENSNKV